MAMRVFGSVLVAIILSACSTGRLTGPIGQFADAARAAEAAIIRHDQVFDAALQAEAIRLAQIPNGPRIAPLDPADCGQLATECRLVVRDADGGTWPVNNAALTHDVRDMLAVVVAYAGALQRLVAAGSAAEVQQAVNAAKASVLAAAGTIDQIRLGENPTAPPILPDVQAYAAPVADLVTFGLQRVIEAVKLQGLREATDAMSFALTQDGAIADILDEYMQAVRLYVVTVAQANYRAALVRYQSNLRDAAAIRAYAEAAEKFDLALSTPTDIASNLLAAHEALTNALRIRDMTFAEMQVPLQELFSDVARLAEILNRLSEAAGA